MKRITTPALALFLLCTAAATAQDKAGERAAILAVIDKAFAAVAYDDPVLDFQTPDGWRFYRRLQRVESFQSND